MNNTKFTETEVCSMRNALQKLMQTLQKNKEQVPVELLQTKYRKGYFSLINHLKQTASEYAGFLILHDIRIHRDYLDEVTVLIQRIINSTGILPQLSAVVFQLYDINQFEALAQSTRTKIMEELEFFYGRNCCLYFSEDCLDNSAVTPEIHCLVIGCIWMNGKWLPAEQSGKNFLEKNTLS